MEKNLTSPAELGVLRSSCGSIAILDVMDMVAAFHIKYGLPFGGTVNGGDEDWTRFRIECFKEEIAEYAEAAGKVHDELSKAPNHRDVEVVREGLEEQLDALVDLVYFAVGTAYTQFGAQRFKEAFTRVHRANMTKVRGEAKDTKRGHGNDLIKPPGWLAPCHHDLIDISPADIK
jgi:hypothetical protein